MKRVIIATAEGPLGQRMDTIQEVGYFHYKCGACGEFGARHNRKFCPATAETTARVVVSKVWTDGQGDRVCRLAAHVRVGNKHFIQKVTGVFYCKNNLGDHLRCKILPGSKLVVFFGQDVSHAFNIVVP